MTTTIRRRHLAATAVALASLLGMAAATPATAVAGPAPAGLRAGDIGRLSLAQLAGQRVIYSYPGLTPPPALFTAIRRDEAGGVIFFGENISSSAQIKKVIAELQRANASSPLPVPLLMMTDQEGGLVRRLPGAPVLSEKQVGESSNPATAAAAAGTGAGENLASVGMNVNLAPVLGVYRQPGDFLDQFQRSYSMDPKVVTEAGAAFITAQQRTGVAATAKHFPGLGAATASQNTDVGPVTLDLSRRTLRSVDEAPYPAAIASGVRLVMCSWAVYPALDPSRPAGLSPTIVEGDLRHRLGFRGVTITDALEAGALQAFGSIPHRGVLAAKAGMDLLLYSNRDVNEGLGGLHALVAALRDGQLDRAAFVQSVGRVIALRLEEAGVSGRAWTK